ncbi:hypothetical protein Droror1_Dr00001459 [Drosera rotundifolia]
MIRGKVAAGERSGRGEGKRGRGKGEAGRREAVMVWRWLAPQQQEEEGEREKGGGNEGEELGRESWWRQLATTATAGDVAEVVGRLKTKGKERGGRSVGGCSTMGGERQRERRWSAGGCDEVQSGSSD